MISFHDRGGGGDKMQGTREQWRNEQKRLGADKICITPTLTCYMQAPRNVFQSGGGGGLKYLRSGRAKRAKQVERKLAWGQGAKPKRGVKGRCPLKFRVFRHLKGLGNFVSDSEINSWI